MPSMSMLSAKLVERLGIGEIDALEPEPIAELLLQAVEPGPLQATDRNNR